MSNVLTELKTLDDLDALIASGTGGSVLIYKHSVTCGTSGVALEEIRDLLAGPPIEAPVGKVVVQTARVVSDAVATRYGVRHESPQVLLVRDGRVAWHASHFRVTAEAIAAALHRHHASGGS